MCLLWAGLKFSGKCVVKPHSDLGIEAVTEVGHVASRFGSDDGEGLLAKLHQITVLFAAAFAASN